MMTVSAVSFARSRSRKRARLVSVAALLAAAVMTLPYRADGAPSPAVTPTCFGEPATIVANNPGSNVVNGTPKADVIVVPRLEYFVEAGKGADRVCGGISSSSLEGGPGKDRLKTGSGGDSLYGGPGNDVLRESRGSLDANLHGGKGADLLIGPHDMSGGDGDDVLRGKSTNRSGAVMFGDLTGGAGDDRVFGSDRGDSISGGAGEDQLSGNAGDDSINGGRNDDLLLGGTGDDELNGGVDNDDCRGEAGTDSAVNCEALSDVP